MDFTCNEKVFGFSVDRVVPIEELEATMYELTHEHTGLKLVWLKRPEENKTFDITFATQPWNDTGVFHILEHSVLCGSAKYPVKEPFVELLKSSMNTFLNAMTFQDKTMYPVSSTNPRDFMNLVSVYLDAVFAPSIYTKPEIFGQEGWHYELDENGEPSYKGVVFNEMKGAFADADEILQTTVNRALLPDTTYAYCSGGDPVAIPTLTYEAFVDSHRRFYSPSNAFVILDGDLDPIPVLKLMEEGYLSKIEPGVRMDPPAFQVPVDGGTVTVDYELSNDQEPEGKTRIALACVAGRYDEREKNIGLAILTEALCGSNQAPLTAAVLKAGLAEDVRLSVMDETAQTLCILELINVREENAAAAEELVKKTLSDLVKKGLDKEELKAIIANMEFKLRERDFGSFPKGLVFAMTIMNSWLYGGAPEAFLSYGELFNELRNRMESGWFESLLSDTLLTNPHSCRVIMKPSHTLGEERRREEADRIAAEAAAWSAEERAVIKAKQESLEAWQHSEDTPEQLATLPHLALSDLEPNPEVLPTEVSEHSGLTVLSHDINAGGILYLRQYYDVTWATEDELPYLSFLATVMGELGTKEHSAEEIIRRNRLLCGNMSFGVSAARCKNGNTTVRFEVSYSALEQNMAAATALVDEILTSTVLDETAEEACLDILRQEVTNLFQRIVMSGSSYAIGRVNAQHFGAFACKEAASGVEYYRWMKKQQDNWDWNEMSFMLNLMRGKVLRKERMTVSITGSASAFREAYAAAVAADIPVGLTREAFPASSPVSPWGIRKEAIVIPADIAFAVRGGNHGEPFCGSMSVAAKIVSLAYLWNVIRVQGGAYGSGLSITREGMASCYSYRDPNGAQSLAKYEKVGEFLRAFVASDPDLVGFIISTISDASGLMTPRMKGSVEDARYFAGMTYEDRAKSRREVLSCTKEDLLQAADRFEKAIQNGGICMVGGAGQVKKEDFDSVITL